jgi:hypothetical protein
MARKPEGEALPLQVLLGASEHGSLGHLATAATVQEANKLPMLHAHVRTNNPGVLRKLFPCLVQ